MNSIISLAQDATQYIAYAVLLIGLIATVVSVIVQAIKDVTIFKGLPTDLLVLVLSIVITILVILALCSYCVIAITWYIIIASIISGFFVSVVARDGWSTITSIYGRCIKKTK